MSTQFFQRQDASRSNTAWLIVLFVLAVVGIVGMAAACGYFASEYALASQPRRNGQPQISGLQVGLICGCIAGVVILLGSLYQIISLRAGGGSGVAESIGGRPLIVDTATPDEKRLLNIVEEMAIASGTPVPPVYLLDEDAINAFAAGYRPSDAVLGVTRGTIENLNREQLQGVIAHEFSHILNGDMRINIRMIGILYGILLLSLLGRILFQSLRFAGGSGTPSSRDNKGRGGILIVMLVTGLALMLIGWVGSFIGGLIKAAVCRQREYLADASAVQFTRNPAGIAGALKKIGAIASHGRLTHPNAAVASHMYFSQGVFEGFAGLLATHPPLHQRILAIEPNWDGSFTASKNASRPRMDDMAKSHYSAPASMGFAGSPSRANDVVPAKLVRDAVEHVGAPEESHQLYAASLLASIDEELKRAASNPYSVRALVFAMLIDRDPTIAASQIHGLRQILSGPGDRKSQPNDSSIVDLTQRLVSRVATCPDTMRLPLVDLALPMLRRMSVPQYQLFVKAFDMLVQADRRMSIFEWTLSQILKRNLRSQFSRPEGMRTSASSLHGLAKEVSLLLTMLARIGHREAEVANAFSTAAATLPSVNVQLVPTEQCTFTHLESALQKLRRSSERCRGELLNACAACVTADENVKVREAELIRGIADLLECPLPPLAGHSI